MDYISSLNKICQKSGIDVDYVISKGGTSDHLPIWTVEIILTSGETVKRFFSDEAGSAKEAKRQVAKKAFDLMNLPEKEDSLNYIGVLNVFCQKKGISMPSSSKVQRGEDWKVKLTLRVNDDTYTSKGINRTVKDAKQIAARSLLEKVKTLEVAPKVKRVELSTVSDDDPPETPNFVKRSNFLMNPSAPSYLPKAAIKIPSTGPCKCSSSSDFLPNIIIFIDADNVPTQACLHYRCRTISYLGKMTPFPPKKYAEVLMCSNEEIKRCNWHSSDAADVLIAMEIGMLGKTQESPKCIIISGDGIMQSVCSSALFLGIDAEWHMQVPEKYLMRS
jgi:hypothetical protein